MGEVPFDVKNVMKRSVDTSDPFRALENPLLAMNFSTSAIAASASPAGPSENRRHP
jgi:hypothetical protein